MIEDLIVIEEAHLKDPKGNVERRLATITEDRQQVERNPLEVPSPRPSEIVRNWPEKMWCKSATKVIDESGVHFCSIGILAETSGFGWGEPDWDLGRDGKIWDASTGEPPALFVGRQLGLDDRKLYRLGCVNDNLGKEAAADLLESWGL